jgi:phosphoribosylanthranilate isomerase
VVRVKICGLTRVEDVETAVEAGADYLGFILYPRSPRYVEPSKLRDLLKACGNTPKVAVMVDPSPEEILRVLDLGFDFIQLHGNEEPELVRSADVRRVIKAFRIREGLPEGLEDWRDAHAVLLDTYLKGTPGGTGRTFNWSLAREAVRRGFRVFLAGGLNPENVRSAVEKVRPYCVDVSSGVEISPGIKDKMKVRKFVEEAKFS